MERIPAKYDKKTVTMSCRFVLNQYYVVLPKSACTAHRTFVYCRFNRNQSNITCRVNHTERDRKTHFDHFSTDNISCKLQISLSHMRNVKNKTTDSSLDRRHSRFKHSSFHFRLAETQLKIKPVSKATTV